DHAFSGVAPGTPQKIVLMSADGRGQTVLGAEQIDGPRLAVGLGEDRGARADVRGQAVVDARNGGRHLVPSELIREDLWQRSQLVRLNCRLLQTYRVGV